MFRICSNELYFRSNGFNVHCLSVVNNIGTAFTRKVFKSAVYFLLVWKGPKYVYGLGTIFLSTLHFLKSKLDNQKDCPPQNQHLFLNLTNEVLRHSVIVSPFVLFIISIFIHPKSNCVISVLRRENMDQKKLLI